MNLHYILSTTSSGMDRVGHTHTLHRHTVDTHKCGALLLYACSRSAWCWCLLSLHLASVCMRERVSLYMCRWSNATCVCNNHINNNNHNNNNKMKCYLNASICRARECVCTHSHFLNIFVNCKWLSFGNG